jgi:hypothetical protein
MVALAAALAAATHAPRAEAHQGGALQVNLAKMTVTPTGPTMWHVVLLLQDQDSGTPAWGMDVTLHATSPSGAVLEPIKLSGDGKGHYDGHFEGPPGPWRFAVHADPTPGGQVALTFDAQRELALSPAGATSTGHSGHHRAGAGLWSHASSPTVLGIFFATLAGGWMLLVRRRAMVPGTR